MREWLTSLPARVIEALLAAAVLALGGKLLGLGTLSVAVWIMLGGSVVLLSLGHGLANLAQGGRRRSQYYGEHVREAIESMQKGTVGEIPGVTWGVWIERGIMGPACHWLARRRGEEVRMSVIMPNPANPANFMMSLESGHSIEARQDFRLPVAGTFAGHALQSGETQWTNNVDKDPRWRVHPRARASRAYGSLVSVPIKRADGMPVGVFNVISTRRRAFSPSELAYVELLGSLVNFAWTMNSEFPNETER